MWPNVYPCVVVNCYTKTKHAIDKCSFIRLQANGEAAQGKYAAGSVIGAGADATLFVANHAY